MKFKIKRYYKLFLVLVLLVFISGCVEVKQPTVTGSATIKHINIEYDLDILLTNPNNFDFTVTDISIVLQRENGENIGMGTILGGIISKQDSKHFYGVLRLEDSILIAQYDETVYLIIETTAKGGIWPIEKKEKIYRKIKMNNPIKGKTELEINI
ncbi:MAG: hypothetical protein KAR87_02275 [Candidatus Aenigmarchaeota archaeon]|nr:hypothetical protein [Candidatus Aenigmarchaeota archaeon]